MSSELNYRRGKEETSRDRQHKMYRCDKDSTAGLDDLMGSLGVRMAIQQQPGLRHFLLVLR